MPLLGAHMSVSGGLYRAADAAAALGMQTVQIFTHSPSQWAVKPITGQRASSHSAERISQDPGHEWLGKSLSDEDVARFREAIASHGLQIPCAHDSYLINLASPDEPLWRKSLDAFTAELERAEALGLAGVVMHPGSSLDGTVEGGLARVAEGLHIALQRTAGCVVEVWVETTAGQGTNLGHRFEHLQFLIDHVPQTERMGICVDTCHIFAAGYAIQATEEYQATFEELDRLVGLDRIRAFHLNDSKKGRGSRVDRHEHIGEGELGLAPFRQLINDERFASHPMYLETKKEKRDGREMDAINLETLRSLMAAPQRKSRSRKASTKS